MASSKRHLDIDPDYEIITQPSIKKTKPKEESEEIKYEKARKIISREFQVELVDRQKELELIQQRLTKAKKILHLVRYLVVTSFYNNKDVSTPPEEAVIDATGNSIVSQNRIHPAVKKIIGKSPARLNFNLESRSSKRASRKKTENLEENVVCKEGDEDSIKTIIEFKSKPVEEKEETATSVGSKVNINNLCSANDGRARKKQTYRIVIGNISKFMPAESVEDSSTHKWMVYVRGPKEAPDITNIVKKVRFFLHPSYEPHDVVEVREAPFHLSRRGWGEFPLRVQLYFQCSSNKPVDVIHNIKLDRTYTGRQTLGNETIYNLHLYTIEEQQSQSSSCVSPTQEKCPVDKNSTQTYLQSGLKRTTSTCTSFNDESMEESVSIKQEPIKVEEEEILVDADQIEIDQNYDLGSVKRKVGEPKSQRFEDLSYNYTVHLHTTEEQQSQSSSCVSPTQEQCSVDKNSTQTYLQSGLERTTSTCTSFNDDSMEESVLIKQEPIEVEDEEILVDEDQIEIDQNYDFGSVKIEAEEPKSERFVDLSNNYTVKYEDIEKPSCSKVKQDPVDDIFVGSEHDYCNFSVKSEPCSYEVCKDGFQNYSVFDLYEEENIFNCQLNQEHSYSFGSVSDPSASVVEEEIIQDESFCYESSDCLENLKPSPAEESTNDLRFGLAVSNENDNETVVVEEMVLTDDLNLNSKLSATNHSLLKSKQQSVSYFYHRIVTPDGKVILIKKPKKPQVSLLKTVFRKNLSNPTNGNGAGLLKIKSVIRPANCQQVTENACENRPPPALVKIASKKCAKENANVDVLPESETPIDYQKYRVDFPANRFKNLEDSISFLLKRLPLISNLAEDVNYKCTYPFTAPSEKIFRSWPIGKRLSSEWSRAKEVKKILISKEMCDSESITTKYIINFARSHCFTPFLDELFNKTNQNDGDAVRDPHSQLAFDDLSDVVSAKANLQLGAVKTARSNGFIDIIDVDDSVQEVIEVIPSAKRTNKQKCREAPEHSFIRETCAEIGINLIQSESVILKATLCFAENLIRNAYASRISNNKDVQRDGVCIDLADVYKGLLNKKFRMFFKPDFQHPLLE